MSEGSGFLSVSRVSFNNLRLGTRNSEQRPPNKMPRVSEHNKPFKLVLNKVKDLSRPLSQMPRSSG